MDHADTLPMGDTSGSAAKASAAAPTSSDRYELGDEIARGGMGRVVEATDKLLGRTVALKAALASEPEAIRRFARETRVTARLEHPSIVPVYDAGKTPDGVPYYVMRKVAGRPLEALVHERRTIDERLALLPHVLAAVEAVAHAHARGVIHRDLKPSNILVGELGETVVIDWGLAKVIDDPDDEHPEEAPGAGEDTALKTREGQVVGTPGFMAPEQLHGELATPACDVYALGGTLYHVLAGEPPHAARSSDEMIALALMGPPRSLADVVDGVPRELATIVERAMAYNEHLRYADGTELAADLRRFLTGQLVAAHRYSRRERVVRFVKRYRAATAVALIALGVIGVLSYVSITRIVRERDVAENLRGLALQEKQAAEEASAREAERADDLLIARASGLVATNPTVAVGLLHQLPPTSKVWRRARDVLAEARAYGVPWALPASGFTSGLAITRDGKLAFSAGNDGVVRRHDLETRATATIAAQGTLLGLTGDEKTLVLAHGGDVVWVELAGAKQTTTPVGSGDIEQLAVAGDAAIVVAGARVRLVRKNLEPVDIAIGATKVFGVTPSPDGTRVAINADPDAAIVELASLKVVVRRPSRSMEPAWSADGKRVAMARVNGLDEIGFDGAAPVTRAITTTPGAVQSAAYVGEDLYFATAAQTVFRHHPGDGIVQLDLPPALYVSATTSRDAAIFVGANGQLAVASRGMSRAIPGPGPRMVRAVAHAANRKAIAVIADHVVLYDLAVVVPRTLDVAIANTTFRGFAGTDHFIVASMVDDWKQLAIASGQTRSLGKLELGQFVTSSPDGSYAIARKNASSDLVLMRPGEAPAPLLAVRHAAALSATHAVIASDKDVQAFEIATGTRTPLWSSPTPIGGLLAARGYIVAYAQGTLWRSSERARTSSTIEWTGRPTAVAIAADGAVWLAADSSIWIWPTTGSPHMVAKLSRPIAQLAQLTGIGCVAIDDRRNATIVDDTGKTTRFALPAGYDLAMLADEAPLLAALTQDRRLAVYDLETGYGWRLGPGDTLAAIAPDGRHLATYQAGHLAFYSLELPADREAYETLLDTATNFRAEPSGELVWPSR